MGGTRSEISKGIILAGGDGTRLAPLSHAMPKHLLPVANKPVIDHIVEDLREAGITEVGVVIGRSSAEALRDHVGDGSRYGVDVTYIHQGEPLGLAHAVGCARPFVDGDPFVVYLGDTIVGDGVTDRLVDAFDPSRHAAGLPLQTVDQPSRFGIVERDGDEVVRVHEKPEEPPTNLAYMGVLALAPTVFEHIERLDPSWRGELELTDALDSLATAGEPIAHYVEDGLWRDVGTPVDLVETNRVLLEGCDRRIAGSVKADATVRGRVELGPSSTVESGAVVEGPVRIGAGTTVESDARIGPYTSIGDDCTVARASVESSVVLDDVTVAVEDRLVDSILGQGIELTNGNDDDGTRYVVGHNAAIRK